MAAFLLFRTDEEGEVRSVLTRLVACVNKEPGEPPYVQMGQMRTLEELVAWQITAAVASEGEPVVFEREDMLRAVGAARAACSRLEVTLSDVRVALNPGKESAQVTARIAWTLEGPDFPLPQSPAACSAQFVKDIADDRWKLFRISFH